MTQERTSLARGRTFLFPLMVALPTFFALYTLMVGLWLVGIVEHGWDSGSGSVWQSLAAARRWNWWLAGGGAVCGLVWAWIILLPARKYRNQLERFAEEGRPGALEVDLQSELSYLALSFNRVMEEVGRNLPKRIHTILESISSGILLLDDQGVIESVNPQAARLLETSEDRLEGFGFGGALSRSPQLLELVKEALRNRSDYPHRVIRINDRSGGTRRIGVWLAWVRDSDQQPVTLSLTLVDLQRMDRIASDLASAERMRLLGAVGRGMAHEIRNPLASIRGLSQLLLEKEDIPRDKIESYSQVMMEEVDRVNRVVDRLSLFVSAQPEETEAVPISDLFASCREMTGHLAMSKRVALDMAKVDSDLTVSGVRQLLVQALSNVVINGIEAAPENGRVRLEAHSTGDAWVAITVENDGPPIHPAEFDDIFQPFYTTKDNASGLGMTITDSIVLDHGGKIEVRSKSKSTIFSILLPERGSNPLHDSLERQEIDAEIPPIEAALIGGGRAIASGQQTREQATSLVGERFEDERV